LRWHASPGILHSAARSGGRVLESAGKWSPGSDRNASSPVSWRARVDANTLQTTWKKDGKVVMTTHGVVSKDGKTRTVTFNGTNPDGKKVHNVVVYDKEM
jgi:hypothetical protein